MNPIKNVVLTTELRILVVTNSYLMSIGRTTKITDMIGLDKVDGVGDIVDLLCILSTHYREPPPSP